MKKRLSIILLVITFLCLAASATIFTVHLTSSNTTTNQPEDSTTADYREEYYKVNILAYRVYDDIELDEVAKKIESLRVLAEQADDQEYYVNFTHLLADLYINNDYTHKAIDDYLVPLIDAKAGRSQVMVLDTIVNGYIKIGMTAEAKTYLNRILAHSDSDLISVSDERTNLRAHYEEKLRSLQ